MSSQTDQRRRPRTTTNAVVTMENLERNETRRRLLDAAEALFADYGFNVVTVREIAARANANLGAIPYHFGTKENLFKYVMLRRIQPIRAERERRLRELEDSDSPVNTGILLEILLDPALRGSRQNDQFRKLVGRSATDPTPEVRAILDEIYDVRTLRLIRKLRESLPDLPDEEFYWRLMCVYGVMFYVQADTGRIQSVAGKNFKTSEVETALKYVLPFLEAGLLAPPTKPTA